MIMKNMVYHKKNIEYKSGIISIIGAPNVGKSTLLNMMLKEKISITSRKPQTTRNKILGILNLPSSQLIFIDTPGIHKTKSVFNAKLVGVAVNSLQEADVILLVVDVSKHDTYSENILLDNIKKLTKPIILALNKIDIIKKENILKEIDNWRNLYDFKSIVPISAKKNIQIDELISEIEKKLEKGPLLFPEDYITDMPQRFIAAEMIREKVFRYTGDEIPYSTAVTIETFSEETNNDKPIIKISAVIHVERDSQKGIIIGKNGLKLKEIGIEARKDIEKMTGVKVFLKLFVRIQKNWSNDIKAMYNFGY